MRTLYNKLSYFTVTLLGLGKTYRKKQSKPSPFDKNSRTTHRIWHKLFSIIQSAGIKNWFPQSINRLYMFNLLFLSAPHFFLIFTIEWNMHKNKDKKFYRIEEISFKWLLFWQYCQEPDLEPNQKSMVEHFFAKNDLLVVVLDGLFFIWETE